MCGAKQLGETLELQIFFFDHCRFSKIVSRFQVSRFLKSLRDFGVMTRTTPELVSYDNRTTKGLLICNHSTGKAGSATKVSCCQIETTIPILWPCRQQTFHDENRSKTGEQNLELYCRENLT